MEDFSKDKQEKTNNGLGKGSNSKNSKDNQGLPSNWIYIDEKTGNLTIDTNLLPGGNGTYYTDLRG